MRHWKTIVSLLTALTGLVTALAALVHAVRG